MAKKSTAIMTGRIPLDFAKKVGEAANAAYADGTMEAAVSPITRELLKYWFKEPFTNRPLNFHEGQRQAILNAIYLHEVIQAAKMADAWEKVAPELLGAENGAVMAELAKEKYAYPKYCVKMATGTGKTWVMHALLIWQYLNARAKGEARSRAAADAEERVLPPFTKSFLFVAPGLIVYERLLDAFCGKRIDGGEARDFATSDIKSCESLFVPPQFREALYGFLQNSLVRKEEFGRKVTGDGVLAVMNWHAFLNNEEANADAQERVTTDDGKGILDDLLPAKPGMAAGNALESLDAAFLRGGRLDFLKDLPDLMLVNDEAHHIHGGKLDKEEAVKWQKGIDALAAGKKCFLQVDFSATPYEPSGSGKKAREDFFPHIMADYPLPAAIRDGRVKTIVIDQRKALAGALVDLDYNAERDDGGRVVGLSDGQRLMLRAGLTKLRYLEGEFAPLDASRKPKMMVVCEDTSVTPFVEAFLRDEGLSEDDILSIDSNRQGEVGEKEWEVLKGRLFAIDRHDKPRVIVSVMMLREGFDVNNVCVIVPLRAAGAQILLEQTIGRGLRLMWREPEYGEVKEKARRQLLVEKTEPCAVLDFLYIIEHPNFVSFYDKMAEEGLVGAETEDGKEGGGTADLVLSELKPDFGKWDLFWPLVRRESEELLPDAEMPEDAFKPFTLYPLSRLRAIFAKEGEVFVGKEMLVKTTFGEYSVHANLFNAQCYNDYIRGIVEAVSRRFMRIGGNRTKARPALQVNLAQIAAVVDRFIRTRLFGEPFDPLQGSDWKILLCLNGTVTEHIVQQVGELVYRIETGTVKTKAEVDKLWFSQVRAFVVRRSCALELTKTIYTLTGFPAHGGGLERDFAAFVDADGGVERFVKINEAKHDFARIAYLRTDGLMGEYIPDFLVATRDHVWLVETKAAKDKPDGNVQAKRTAALQWCKSVNALEPEDRMERDWGYLLLTDKDFYAYRDGNATFADFCDSAELTESELNGEFSF